LPFPEAMRTQRPMAGDISGRRAPWALSGDPPAPGEGLDPGRPTLWDFVAARGVNPVREGAGAFSIGGPHVLLMCPPDAHPGALMSAAAFNAASMDPAARALVLCREAWAAPPGGGPRPLPEGVSLPLSRDVEEALERVEHRYVRDDRDVSLCLAHAHLLPYRPRALLVPDLGSLFSRHAIGAPEQRAAAVRRLLALLVDTADHFTRASGGVACRIYVSLEVAADGTAAATAAATTTGGGSTVIAGNNAVANFHDTEFLCRRFLPSVVVAARREPGHDGHKQFALCIAGDPPGADRRRDGNWEVLPYDITPDGRHLEGGP